MSTTLSHNLMTVLPPGPPTVYRAMAEVVVAAWGDVALRERLRDDPRATLSDRGVELTAGERIEIVGPEGAPLPTARVVALPLPAAGAAAVRADRARAALATTPFGALLEDAVVVRGLDVDPGAEGAESEYADAGVDAPATAGEAAARPVAARRWPWSDWSWSHASGGTRTALALAGVAVLILALGVALPGSGTAGGAASHPGFAIVVIVVGTLAVAAWMVARGR